MALSSLTVGITTELRLVGFVAFDIVLYLSTIGAPQTDDSSHAPAIYVCHAVEEAGERRERDMTCFAVLEPSVDPHERGFPIEFDGECQRNAMLREIGGVLLRVELDLYSLM